jgi:hypothetical protein
LRSEVAFMGEKIRPTKLLVKPLWIDSARECTFRGKS